MISALSKYLLQLPQWSLGIVVGRTLKPLPTLGAHQKLVTKFFYSEILGVRSKCGLVPLCLGNHVMG